MMGEIKGIKLINWCASSGIYAWKRAWALVFAIFVGIVAHAQISTPPLPPASAAIEARLKKLETELRCLVCQNQTLAESPANLAGDLRREIRVLAELGQSNDEIKQFLKSRYGDFVLYNPPVQTTTYLLWFGPFVLLLSGAGLLIFMARRRQQPVSVTTVDEATRRRASALLDE